MRLPTQEQSCSGLSRGQVVAAIAIPSCVALVALCIIMAGLAAAKAAARFRRKVNNSDQASQAPKKDWRGLLAKNLFGKKRRPEDEDGGQKLKASIDNAPPAGPDTTLLLSDVQNSTSLW